MDTDWQTFGHETVKNILGKQLATGHFSHAYLFCGPEGIGKKYLALEFAKKILQTERLEIHPDFKILDAEGEISIDSARDFIASLSYKPFAGKKKVAIVNNAQNLNPQSGNALLKTLEEPSDSSVIILISTGKSLLPTIVSRCQVFNFNSFSQKMLAKYVRDKKIELPQEKLPLCFGSVSRLEKSARDKNYFQGQSELAEQWEKLKTLPAAERLLTIANYSDLETEELKQVFQTWVFWQLGKLRSDRKNFSVLTNLTSALQQLQTNKNKKFVLQGLFLNM